ncbi:hypothetical protein D3C72_1187400 [compost metagenome]
MYVIHLFVLHLAFTVLLSMLKFTLVKALTVTNVWLQSSKRKNANLRKTWQ